ncbi:MAG: 50S ribosomal protein L3 N(5)-glutamine methyltransferase [Gammaproteobacteria bacterium]|nr:MAG: 50S ribosomal protein L3 N(5)-glutamine methyltransferase [Gammaproteobacteria bacterium]RLA53924.1 MAG: 50S ribosomal protein L3 N(5)-glutamine methyltransferase [Gammaproteobacteria bacterium]
MLDSSIKEQLNTVRDYIRYGASSFNRAGLYFGHGTDNAWDEATALVLHSLHLSPYSKLEVLDARLTDAEKDAVADIFEQRIGQRVPTPYLIGESWFAGLKFHVDDRVLIPRSPIAELIESEFAPWLYIQPQRILDLCTGSGCIGIACALAFPDAQVLLSDISRDALAVAEKNIAEHEVGERVTTVESDLFAAVSECFDFIVANPPYVDADDLSMMPEEYRHEPKLALASGRDGLDFTRRLLREAAEYLSEKGCLCVEVGNSREHLEEEFPGVPFNWLDFERGGQGVFILYRQDLIACADCLG